MRTTARKIFLGALLCALFLLVSTAGPAARVRAQDRSEMLVMTVVHVRPEMDTAVRNFMKTRTNPALKRGGLKWRDVWQTAQFGDLFTYYIVAPMENYAQFDKPMALEKGLGGAAQLAAWREAAGRLITDARTFTMRFRPDLSYETEMTGPPKMGVLSIGRIVPGRSREFEQVLKEDYLPAIRQSKIQGWWVSQTMMGGDANEYISLALHENFAEIDKGPPVARAVGQEKGAELLRKLWKDNVLSVERTVIRFIPELSFRQ